MMIIMESFHASMILLMALFCGGNGTMILNTLYADCFLQFNSSRRCIYWNLKVSSPPPSLSVIDCSYTNMSQLTRLYPYVQNIPKRSFIVQFVHDTLMLGGTINFKKLKLSFLLLSGWYGTKDSVKESYEESIQYFVQSPEFHYAEQVKNLTAFNFFLSSHHDSAFAAL